MDEECTLLKDLYELIRVWRLFGDKCYCAEDLENLINERKKSCKEKMDDKVE